MSKRIDYADDEKSSVKKLIRLRLPSILLGLALGVILSFVFSGFEEVLSKDIRVAYFIPFVVYIASAVGTQTQSIFSRDLKTGRASLSKYFSKEMLVGLIMGIVSGILSAIIVILWFRDPSLTLVVSSAMFVTVTIAPIIALVVTELLQLEHLDPAVGAGPIATVIQDTLSVVIYGTIATLILL